MEVHLFHSHTLYGKLWSATKGKVHDIFWGKGESLCLLN